MAITEDQLMAYADGELDAKTRAKVEAALAADPALAQRLERHRRLRQTLGQAHAGALNEPIPQTLLAAVRSGATTPKGAVIDLAEVRAKRARAPEKPTRTWDRWGALAACLLVMLAVGAAVMNQPARPLIASTAKGLTAQGALAHALDHQLTASPTSDGAIKIGVSFRSLDHSYCRTFQINQGEGLAGVACREPRAWAIRATTVSSSVSASTTGYRTASSAIPAPITAAVDAMIDGQPLDAAGEAAGKAARWKPAP
jgi:hypothetical protein